MTFYVSNFQNFVCMLEVDILHIVFSIVFVPKKSSHAPPVQILISR